ncbi:putative pentatricopeptide repeat-containing protein At3g11460, mitochondrial [Phoenix dactylifera]|uniref:Pentatricopeptide repeat-containing protein At3g11460, mitochondrial n=1 Tax=Phoenix dactylifera TaxID=42345 RepID=A0A8B7CEG4_PHODC|nr:putative pentatricopeptide repeat-containing protein At3g11460, mitochondrial [Phoenix dactylifera]
MFRSLRLLTAPSFPPSLLLRTNCHSLPFNDFLNSCSSVSALQCLHARILTQGLSHHLALATKLISIASALSPTIDYARKIFDTAPHRDSFMWNTLLRGYADSGPCEEVPVLYKQMHRMGLSPDHFTFPFVVRSCAVISALREGKEVHCNAIKTGFDSNAFLQSALVTMYSQNGEISDSELVFSEMTSRNIVSWTAMIAGYAQNCLLGKAVRVFQRMLASGTQPNDVTLASVLPALKGLECLHSGESIHGYMIKRGLDSHVSLMNALIAMYGKCGSIKVARFLFNRMPVRSLVSWNTMIAAYEQSGDGMQAVKLFRGMLTEKATFNSVTLVSVISACSSLGALETGEWVHKLAKSRGLESDVIVGNALSNMYAKCGNVDSAREIFEKLPWRGVVSWSAMIGACAAHGHAEMALELFSKMQAEGVRPNAFTFTSVLAACSHSGLVDEGMEHFESMEKDYAIKPTVEHCACMVDLLGRAGRLVDAYEFIKRMPVEPDASVWGALLGACRIHGNLELAEFVAEDLFRLGSHNATFYVLMSNMYAEAGRWEDAARLRNMMRELELKKIPGCSLVNTDKRSHNVPFMMDKLACSI